MSFGFRFFSFYNDFQFFVLKKVVYDEWMEGYIKEYDLFLYDVLV